MMKIQYCLLFILFSILNYKFVQSNCNFPSDCQTYSDTTRLVEYIDPLTDPCCYILQPYVGKNIVVASITLQFVTFDFSNTLFCKIFKGAQASSSTLIQTLTGNLTGTLTTMTIDASVVSIAMEGSGSGTFQIIYSSSDNTLIDPSLNVFYSLLFVFLIPMGFATALKFPCLSSKTKDEESKKRTTTIVFIISTILGFFFFILTLSGVMIKG